MDLIRTASRGLAAACLWAGTVRGEGDSPERPNVLWLTVEDISPYGFHCYGNDEVYTPHIDALAARGIRYLNATSVAPQCSPARSSLISGSLATTYGTDLHRTRERVPIDRYLFPKYLRDAGYFTTNNEKTDYNIHQDIRGEAYRRSWDRRSNMATYNDPARAPEQPFFSVFNNFRTHMTRMVTLTAEGRIIRIDPDSVTLPPHMPDHPDIRSDYALHLEGAEDIDRWVGLFLDDLEQRGLADNTIIFFYSDHGGCLPRGKAFPFDTGLRVPFIVYAPPRWEHLLDGQPGDVNDRLISFVDLAPTMLSIIGQTPPDHFQGRAFMGPHKAPPPEYNFGFRSNRSRHYDPARAAFDGRFNYIRYFTPHMPHGLRQSYQWQMPAQLTYDRLFLEGKLEDTHAAYYLPKPTEMLFDHHNDPWELNNLAENPAYGDVLQRMRQATYAHMIETGDLGLIPPRVRINAYDWAVWQHAQDHQYPFQELIDAGWTAGEGDPTRWEYLLGYMQHERPEIRFWGASGAVTIMQRYGTRHIPDTLAKELLRMMEDELDELAMKAAEALVYIDPETGLDFLFRRLWSPNGALAGCILEALGDRTAPLIPRLQEYLERSGNEDAKQAVRSVLINHGELPVSAFFTEEEWVAGRERAESLEWRAGWHLPSP